MCYTRYSTCLSSSSLPSIYIPGQVREALRRSRVESRDLRASLFRAEDVIKQLTLTKTARRRGAHNSNAAQRDVSSPAAAAAAANEKERRLVSYLLASRSSGGVGAGGAGERGGERRGEGGGKSSNSRSSSRNSNNTCPVGSSPTNAESDNNSNIVLPSRESLLTRVQQLERELRLADFRNASGIEAAGHGRKISVEEVRLSFLDGFPQSLSAASKDARFILTAVENLALYVLVEARSLTTLEYVHGQN